MQSKSKCQRGSDLPKIVKFKYWKIKIVLSMVFFSASLFQGEKHIWC